VQAEAREQAEQLGKLFGGNAGQLGHTGALHVKRTGNAEWVWGLEPVAGGEQAAGWHGQEPVHVGVNEHRRGEFG
jgi:hypothetical protein